MKLRHLLPVVFVSAWAAWGVVQVVNHQTDRIAVVVAAATTSSSPAPSWTSAPATTSTTVTPAETTTTVDAGEAKFRAQVADQWPRTNPDAAVRALRESCALLELGGRDHLAPHAQLEILRAAYADMVRAGVRSLCPAQANRLPATG